MSANVADTFHSTWRWCFYINLPIGGFTILTIFLFLHIDSPEKEKHSVIEQIRRLDPVGIFFFVPSIVCLILALQWGGSTYPWSAPKTIGLLITFAILFAIFIVYESLTPDTAMVPARIVLNRSIAGSMLFMFLVSASTMCAIYYLSIWFQAVKGDSAMHSGISTIPLVLSLVVMSIIGAAFTQKIGYYVPVMLLSPVLCSIGAGLLSTLSVSSSHSQWIGYQILFGFGVGLGFQASNLTAQTVLPRADVPLGIALVFFMQQLGGSVFLAVAQNIFSSRLVNRLSGVTGLDAKVILNTGATELREVVPPADINTVLTAYNSALTQVFILTAGLSACMILGAAAMEWKSIKGKKGAGNASKNIEAKQEEGEKGTDVMKDSE